MNKTKIIKYNSSKITQKIQFNNNNQPLYNNPHYINKNKNLNIIINNFNTKIIIIINKINNFQFTYKKNPSNKTNNIFYPHNLTSNNIYHILITNFKNNLIHIINQNKQFLQLIQNYNLHLPLNLNTNNNNILFIIKYYNNKIKKIQYLK